MVLELILRQMPRASSCSLGLQPLSLGSPDATPSFLQLIPPHSPLAVVSSFLAVLATSILQGSLLIFQASFPLYLGIWYRKGKLMLGLWLPC